MIEAAKSWALLRSLRSGSRRDPAALERLRGRLLHSAVAHAYERVPMYRRLWDEAGIDPGAIASIADLERLPVLGTAKARDAAERGELLDEGVEASSYPSHETSASSGEPLAIPRGPVEQRLWRAGALRIWFEHGYRWHYTTAHLDPQAGAPHPLQRLGISRSAWITTTSVSEQTAALSDVGAEVIAGTPTMLRRVAAEALTGPVPVAPARIVFCQGEVLDRAARELIARGLGPDPVELYGTTEAGYIAWQCERRGDLHLNAELVAVEILRDGAPAGPGELGSVVVTDLRGRTAPRIRWDTGDLARATASPCPCGRTLPTIGPVEGRAREAIERDEHEPLTQRQVVDALAELAAPQLYRLVPPADGAGDGWRIDLDPSARERGGQLAERLGGLIGGKPVDVVVTPISGGRLKTPLLADRRRG